MNFVAASSAALLALNALAFLAFGWDKRKAAGGRRRIPESTLLALALCGGLAGAWLGMRVFRHKTRKRSFLARMAAVTLLWALVLGAWIWR